MPQNAFLSIIKFPLKNICSLVKINCWFDVTNKIFIISTTYNKSLKKALLHFVAFFHVASLFLYRVDNRKGGVDNKKALELTNSTVFHRGRQRKSSRAGKQNNFFIFQPAINKEISPKNATKHPVA